MEKKSTTIPFPEVKKPSEIEFYENEIKVLENKRLQYMADMNMCSGAISALQMVIDRLKAVPSDGEKKDSSPSK